MAVEDENLLLKYLSMASPYGVICQFIWAYSNETTDGEVVITQHDDNIRCINIHIKEIQADYYDEWVDLEHCKPYLRPMLTMTEEEKEEMHNLLSPEGTAIYENNGIALPINHYGEYVSYEFMNRIIQYLLKNHFDFMGLIPKGIAIEATENNNPYK